MKMIASDYPADLERLEAQDLETPDAFAAEEEDLSDDELIALYFGSDSVPSSTDESGENTPNLAKEGAVRRQRRRKASFHRRIERRLGKIERAQNAISEMLNEGKAWLKPETLARLRECQASLPKTRAAFKSLTDEKKRSISQCTTWALELFEAYKKRSSKIRGQNRRETAKKIKRRADKQPQPVVLPA